MSSSQNPVGSATRFESGPYLERLLAELDRAQISSRIRQARKQAQLTQPELADLLHVHWRTVQTWEHDRVPWDRLEDLAKATGTERDWLLHGEDGAGSEPATVEEIRALRTEVESLGAKVDQILGALLHGSAAPPTPQDKT